MSIICAQVRADVGCCVLVFFHFILVFEPASASSALIIDMYIAYYFNSYFADTLLTRALTVLDVERLGPLKASTKNSILAAFAKRLPKIRRFYYCYKIIITKKHWLSILCG